MAQANYDDNCIYMWDDTQTDVRFFRFVEGDQASLTVGFTKPAIINAVRNANQEHPSSKSDIALSDDACIVHFERLLRTIFLLHQKDKWAFTLDNLRNYLKIYGGLNL